MTLNDITPTQRRVAQLVSTGASYKEIARALRICDSTARVHVNAIAARLPSNHVPAYRRVMLWVICQTTGRRLD